MSKGFWIGLVAPELDIIRDLIESKPDLFEGKPVFKGTEFPVAQLFLEIADSDTITAIAKEFALDEAMLRQFLNAFGAHIDRLDRLV